MLVINELNTISSPEEEAEMIKQAVKYL